MFQAVVADGEVDLSTCYDITEYPAHKNYGFQIHVSDPHCDGSTDMDYPGCNIYYSMLYHVTQLICQRVCVLRPEMVFTRCAL